MTTEDIIIHIFYKADDALGAVHKEILASLYPSEVVTIGMLFALKGDSSGRLIAGCAGTMTRCSAVCRSGRGCCASCASIRR